MLHPIFQIARRNRREGQWNLSVNDARLWYDETPKSPLLGQLYEESERGRSRDVGAVNVGAWNVPGGATHDFLPHARTTDERGELRGLFDGNRSGAIDPTAAHQDAAVHVGNEWNPAGCMGGFGGYKKLRCDPETKEEDESSNPQPDRLEGTCCLTTRVDNGESFV
ncbi:hypothetical protein TcBrA4_0050790 [Trypanosoma cruzi]|nr:hypothetical protein TcBrA4_0050790 [Trypanosoma cruzi]